MIYKYNYTMVQDFQFQISFSAILSFVTRNNFYEYILSVHFIHEII